VRCFVTVYVCRCCKKPLPLPDGDQPADPQDESEPKSTALLWCPGCGKANAVEVLRGEKRGWLGRMFGKYART
jgi:hypothetical protein